MTSGISWRQIRHWNGSQASGFEELCCQLAHTEPEVPSDARFYRKGTPDAGVECYWKLANGEEWAWQAKYFAESLGNKQWEQCDESVKTALERHPALVRLYFCFPRLLPDARTPGRTSAMQRWQSRCVEWSGLAAERGRTVDFVLWDEHELLLRLSKPEHRGRWWFWFNGPSLDASWFQSHVAAAVAQAGDRYTQELHIQLPLAETFEALARTPTFAETLDEIGRRLHQCLVDLGKCGLARHASSANERLDTDLRLALDAVNELPTDVAQELDFTLLLETAIQAQHSVSEAYNAIRDYQLDKERAFEAEHGRRSTSYEGHGADFAEFKLRQIHEELESILDFCESDAARVAAVAAMLLTGDAGVGKTHFLCSIANTQAAADLPVVLLLGEQFDRTEPWTRILQLLGLSCDRDEFLGALNAAGEAAGCRALILIDAINEGEGVLFWKNHLASMLIHIGRYPYLGFAVSIRSAYAVHEAVTSLELIRTEHPGFAGRTLEASRHFFQQFGLPEPNIPLLHPEFDNPLLLKLLCTAIRDSGYDGIPSE